MCPFHRPDLPRGAALTWHTASACPPSWGFPSGGAAAPQTGLRNQWDCVWLFPLDLETGVTHLSPVEAGDKCVLTMARRKGAEILPAGKGVALQAVLCSIPATTAPPTQEPL